MIMKNLSFLPILYQEVKFFWDKNDFWNFRYRVLKGGISFFADYDPLMYEV